MIMRSAAIGLLALAGISRLASPQVSDTHPAELAGIWAHQGKPDSTGGVLWAIIRFEQDGRYRGAEVLVRKSVPEREGEVAEGRWAVVASQAKGAMLCTRRDNADKSRCNTYRLEPERHALTWDTLTFVPADTTLVKTLKLEEL